MKKGKLMLDNVETLIFNDFDEYSDVRGEELNGCDQSFLDDYYKGDYIKWYEDNKNNTACWNCKGCDGCFYCEWCKDCDDCKDCIECEDCKECDDCFECIDCKECDECEDCRYCVNCGGGTGLRHKKDYDEYLQNEKDYDDYLASM